MITSYCNGVYVSHTGVELGFFSSRFWKNNVNVFVKTGFTEFHQSGDRFSLGGEVPK